MPTRLRDRDGRVIETSEKEAERLLATGGYRPDSDAEQLGTSFRAGRDEAYSTFANKLRAGAAGVGRGLTFGATDLLASDDSQREMQALKEANPTISTVTEIGGALLPMGLGGVGALTPAGAIAKGGGAISRKLGGGAVGTIAAGVVEGGVQNMGMYLSDVALQDKQASAEGLVGSLGDGVLWGGGAAGAFSLAGKATTKLRDMLPRGEISKVAAETAEHEAVTSLKSALDDSVAAQRMLQEKLNANKLAKLDTNVALKTARAEQRAAKGAADATEVLPVADEIAPTLDDIEMPTQFGDDVELKAASEDLKRATETLQDWQNRRIKSLGLDDLGPTAADELAATTRLRPKSQLTAEQLAAGENKYQRELGLRGERGDVLLGRDKYAAKVLDDGRMHYNSLAEKTLAEGYQPRWASEFGSETRHEMSLADVLMESRKEYARQGLGELPSEIADELKQQWGAMAKAKTPLSAHGSTPARALDGAIARGESIDDFLNSLGRNSRAKAEREFRQMLSDAADLGYQVVDGNQILDDLAGETVTFDEFTRLKKSNMGPRQRAQALQAKADEKLRELIQGPKRGSGVDAMADMAEGVQAYKAYEAAEYRAAKALGSEAPMGMAQRAQDYAAAIDAQSSRASGAAVLHGEAAQAAVAKTPIDELAAKMDGLRIEEAQLRSEIGKTRINAADTRAALKDADKLARTKAAGELAAEAAPSTGSKVADAGTSLEVLSMLGVGVPSAADIPLIGPLLSLFLKARAIKGVLSRGGASAAATAESRIAARAAGVRSRITGSVEKLLTTTDKVVRKATPHAARMAVLSRKLWEGGPEIEGPEYSKRLDELARGTAPGAVRQLILSNIKAGDPELVEKIIAVQENKLKFLMSKAPKEPPNSVLRTGGAKWEPSRVEQETFARYVAACEDPAGVLEDAAHGNVSIEGIEAVKSVYPDLYRKAQIELLEKSAEMQAALPYSRRVQLSVIFNIPLDATMSPQYLQSMQAQYAPAQPQQPSAPPSPVISSDVTLGNRTQTSLDRISQR